MKCDALPLFRAEEIAKLYVETNILDKGGYAITPAGKGLYLLTPKSFVKDGKINVNQQCPFYNTENNTCMLQEHKPEACNVDNLDRLKTKVIENRFVKLKYARRDLKNIREDRYLYFITSYMDKLQDSPFFYTVKEYYLAEIESNGRKLISGFKIPKIEAVYTAFRPVAKLFNRLQNKYIRKHVEYLEILVGDINRRLKGIARIKIDKHLSNIDYLTDKEKEDLVRIIYTALFARNIDTVKLKSVKNYFKESDKDWLLAIKAAAEYLYNGNREWLEKKTNDVKLLELTELPEPAKELIDILEKDVINRIKVLGQ